VSSLAWRSPFGEVLLFNVLLTNKAVKQCRSLERDLNSRAQELFKILENTPVPFKQFDVRKLKGSENDYRARISGYRVVYRVDWQARTVLVVKIERRSEHTYD